jgi:hypothetical protein
MTTKIILGLSIAISSLNAYAAADDKYPAANFEPSVVYMDKDYAGGSSSAATSQTPKDDKYPAASFEPKIIYSDSNASAETVAQPAEQFDPKYPAAYFKPKVIYP